MNRRAGNNDKKNLLKEEYEKKKEKLNGIESFDELTSGQFDDKLEGAELVVDFDGVVADNIKMRNAQSQVKYEAIKKAKENFNKNSEK